MKTISILTIFACLVLAGCSALGIGAPAAGTGSLTASGTISAVTIQPQKLAVGLSLLITIKGTMSRRETYFLRWMANCCRRNWTRQMPQSVQPRRTWTWQTKERQMPRLNMTRLFRQPRCRTRPTMPPPGQPLRTAR